MNFEEAVQILAFREDGSTVDALRQIADNLETHLDRDDLEHWVARRTWEGEETVED